MKTKSGLAILTGCGLAAFALAFSVTGAAAGQFPGSGGPAYHRDLVSGYPCVTNFCDVLRLPGTRCICTKQNPGEQNLSRLRLACYTREAGNWVACPVRPRHGISVNP